jgi:hypothetical protein
MHYAKPLQTNHFMIKLILFIFLLMSSVCYCQQVSLVDFDDVKKKIADSTGSHFYAELRKKILKSDTVLTKEDYHYLYYGFVFQVNYVPSGVSNQKKKFIELYQDKKYEKALKVGQSEVKRNPVDLDLLLKMSISCLEIGDDSLKHKYAKLYYSILDVIYNSGDGKGLGTAYVVISVNHEYQILNDLGLKAKSQQLITDCDLLNFRKRDQEKVKGRKKLKRLFFNVRMPLLSLSKSFKDVDLPDPDDD